MTSILALLLAVGLAHAAPPSDTYVAVDRGAWLYAAPNDAARRLRAAEVPDAAPHTPTPIVLLQLVAMGPRFAEVKTVTMPTPLTETHQVRSPVRTPPDWAHCYPPPSALAQLGALLYVRRDDLLPVLTRDVSVSLADGAEVALQAGLAVSGGTKGLYRVRGHHLELTVPLPADAVGDRVVQPGGREVADALRFGEAEGPLREAHPQLRMRLSGTDGALALRSPELPPGKPDRNVRLVDRCVSLRLATPLGALPDDDDVREATWPILAPVGAAVTWEDGSPLGQVRGGELPIWSASACAWSPEAGTCCRPPTGLEVAGGGVEDPGVCYVADFPERRHQDSLRAVFTRQSEEHARLVAAFASGQRAVSWSVVKVDGPIEPSDVEESLTELEGMFDHCYLRGLQANPHLAGRLEIKFVTMPNGRVRYTESTWEQADDSETAACLERLIQRVTVLDQIGFDSSTTTVRFSFAQEAGNPPAE